MLSQEDFVEMGAQVKEGRYAYKYRPNMDCQWLITAPTERDKVGLRRIHQPSTSPQVGIKFQYFDLHPVYDHLEVQEEESAEVARYVTLQTTHVVNSDQVQWELGRQDNHLWVGPVETDLPF